MDLIRMLLKMSLKHRYNAEQTLNHEWISCHVPKTAGSSLQAGFADHLRSFRGQNKLRKTAPQIVANRLNDTQVKAEYESMTAYKTFIIDIHASIEEKQKDIVKKTLSSTSSLLQGQISSRELRRQALTALLGARATGVGRNSCLGLSKMVPQGKKKQRDPFFEKKWHDTKTPSILGVQSRGKMLVSWTQGTKTASEEFKRVW